jgi:hypothetical protein
MILTHDRVPWREFSDTRDETSEETQTINHLPLRVEADPNHRGIYVGWVVDKVTPRQVFSKYFIFSHINQHYINFSHSSFSSSTSSSGTESSSPGVDTIDPF